MIRENINLTNDLTQMTERRVENMKVITYIYPKEIKKIIIKMSQKKKLYLNQSVGYLMIYPNFQ